MKQVFVVGGTGFVGRHVCEKLIRAGWQVTVATRRRSQARDIMVLPGLTVLELDVHDERALNAALAGHDALINLVAILHGTATEFERVHVALPQKLARACTAQGVAHVVHVSALGANANAPDAAPSNYLRSKSQGEAVWLAWAQAAKGSDPAGPAVALSLLRPSVIFGVGDRFLNLFARLQKIMPLVPLAGANARFQPVWVEDVAAAVVATLTASASKAQSRIYELVGPEVFSLKQLVRLSGQLSGVCAGWGRPVVAVPLWVGRLQASLMALMPGEPLMSQDNLDSMRIDNVASDQHPGLKDLGIQPATLQAIAQDYLRA